MPELLTLLFCFFPPALLLRGCDSDIVVGVFGNILMVVAILSSSRLSVCTRMHVCVCVRARGLTVKAVYERFKYY